MRCPDCHLYEGHRPTCSGGVSQAVQVSPTKLELLERHWLEFLKWVEKQSPAIHDINETRFWSWYIDTHLTEEQP